MKNVYNIPVLVAINKFSTDTDEEIKTLTSLVQEQDVQSFVVQGFEKGSNGCIDLAKAVVKQCKHCPNLQFAYNQSDDITIKIQKIATRIYGAKDVKYSVSAFESLKKIKAQGYDVLPVVIAKTQYSFSDDKLLLAAPSDFTLNINDLEIKSGAGFIVAIAGNMLLMPGLSAHSAYESMTIDDNGIVSGLF